MEHTYTTSSGHRRRYADGGLYCSRPGEDEAYFDILDDRDREILRLAERAQALERTVSSLLTLAVDARLGDHRAAVEARAVLRGE